MIEIKNLKKAYESVTPIENISVTIKKGDVISVIGPSGTGKSTLLRMINMLERPTSGQIFVDGEEITKPGYPLSKIREKVGMVFQSFNLFNNMTVIENVCFAPINVRKMKPREAYNRGLKLLDTVGLGQFAFAYPSSLSGGQKQRVAIVRSLAMDPEVILFDEPTSALDPTMVGEVQSVIKKLADDGHTMMLVTHDMAFAEKVSNRVFYLDDGGIYEDGTPEVIFHSPKKEKTRAFIMAQRDLHINIDTPQYDFPALYSSVEMYALKNGLAGDTTSKLKAIVEEFCFGIVLPGLGQRHDGDTSVHICISYDDLKKVAMMSAEWNHTGFNFASHDYNVQMALIKHYASDIEYDGDNRIKITI